MRLRKKKWLIPCAAALFTIGASMTSFAAQGWVQENNTWVYYDSNGYFATDAWRKSGDSWFYLDSDGHTAASRVIESDGSYYYVNSVGAMVTNEWREIPSDYEDEDSPDTYWYYFGSNGKAYKAPSSGKTSFKSIRVANGDYHNYAFDSEGRLLSGWVNEDSERVTGEEAWKDGIYYCGNSADGARANNEWRRIDVEDDENDEYNFDGTYWFYFGSNGKKIKDANKTINGGKYHFNENGAAEYEWYESDTVSSTSSASQAKYYNLPTQCWLAKGWFKTVPSEDIDQDAYEDDKEYWFYATGNGKVVTSQIKSINGLRYAFNDKGEMLHGIYKMTFDDNKKLESYKKIKTEDDFPEADEACQVYCFGNSPKEGAMATGKTTIDIDGEKYTFNFRKSGSSKGAGYNGIYDSSIYVQGRMLKADRDEKYKVVEYNGKEYLVGTSGKLAKNKSNVKDGDDKYYRTNSDGTIEDSGYEKIK
ncbi:cell wall-binding protein [Clostridium sp. Marseille-P2415]|uniref:cell wall-binding protein n=1 Tax=Clostridium sp. Marseille-P2415 TaxID=1805471 RepID=UPI0009883FB8|nr:cell wall-binding protein [Clostridium sp. Marseille-P2415]